MLLPSTGWVKMLSGSTQLLVEFFAAFSKINQTEMSSQFVSQNHTCTTILTAIVFFRILTLYMSVNVLLLAQLVFSCDGFIKHSSSEDEDLELPLLDQFRNQQLEVRVIIPGICDIVVAVLLKCVGHNFYEKNLYYVVIQEQKCNVREQPLLLEYSPSILQ